MSKQMPKRGRPRRLLIDTKYRERMAVFATYPELFPATEVARFLGINRDTAMDDLRDVVSLASEDVIR